jgi:hypothetical protein
MGGTHKYTTRCGFTESIHLYSLVFVEVGSLTAYLNPQCMLVSVCFHNLVTYAQRLQDLYSACLMF